MKLCIPESVLKQHVVILGKTGAGKSSKLRHIVEHLLDRNKRVCIIDPKGDWSGLKTSADGTKPGFAVIGFGDFKNEKAQDVPINPQSGKQIAELITTGNRPCIIGFRGWMTADMIRFWLDFASTLFNAQSGELYLIIDEVHNFSPKGKIPDPSVGKCIHWTNRLMAEGRGLGLICLIASQRPQKVHNDTLTSCETLIAARVVHKADRDAIKDWVDGCGDSDKGKEVINGLAQLERPEAWVWSPEAGFGPEIIKFPMFETFDSFAPPQLQKKVSNSGWSAVDLDAVKEKLAKVIEEQSANDPVKLKADLRAARKQLEDFQKAKKVFPIGTARIQIPVFTKSERSRLTKLVSSLDRLQSAIEGTEERRQKQLAHLTSLQVESEFFRQKLLALPDGALVTKNVAQTRTTHAPPAAPVVHRPVPTPSLNGKLPIGEEKILSACIQFPVGVTRRQLTVLTTFKRSTRDAYVARLKEKGYIYTSGEDVIATEAGMTLLPDARPLPTGQALREYWSNVLPEGERKIFDLICESFPDPVSRDVISEATGFKRSTRDAYLSRMSAKILFSEAGRGMVRASEQLFE